MFNKFRYSSGVYNVRPTDHVTITHHFVQLPDHVDIAGNYIPTETGDVPQHGVDPHLYVTSGHLTYQDTSLVRTPHLSEHLTDLIIQDTALIRTPHLSGHLTYQNTSLIRTPHLSGHLTNQDTSLTRTPHLSGHLYT